MKLSLSHLLIFVPVAFLIHFVPALSNQIALFAACCLGIIPLAKVMGDATEIIADKSGPTVGGLLNATLGNAAELIIGLIALSKGYTDIVKASLTGSIIGNLLLVVGISMVAGGMKYKTQSFSKTHTNAAATALIMAAISLFLPTVYHYTAEHSQAGWSEANGFKVSVGISFIILITYASQLLFSLKTHVTPTGMREGTPKEQQVGIAEHAWSFRQALGILGVTTVIIAVLSEYMVGSIEAVREGLGLSAVFIGVIVVAIVGNAAEHSTAVLMALKNKMDLSLEIAIGSSMQVAMFIAPLLVLCSWYLGHPMSLEFTIPEVFAVMSTVWITAHIVSDGECNWVEGAQLLSVYFILGVLFFYLP
ncbi:MAG TPA: calcium/proton exchanger [Candidatus Ozemobacteraceae bacterium]|nr:calcium/proton exchanger [Candidatus Ozemobacteraceae bacterium]HQG28428.1 calcium/proton exchanger [Candidatus Ozemobacteraceae bacterium]